MTTLSELAILNVGEGDTKLSFDSKDLAEQIRAERIVKDMLRRGYMLLVETDDGKLVRATDFDPETSEYVIADLDPDYDPETENREETEETTPTKKAKRKKKGKTKRVSAKGRKGVAVAPIAGG